MGDLTRLKLSQLPHQEGGFDAMVNEVPRGGLVGRVVSADKKFWVKT